MTRRIRLKPTPEQEVLFMKSAGVARWAYNYFLSENERAYQEYLDNGKIGERYIKETAIRKHINNVLKPTTHTWLKEVGSNVMKQAVKDADIAYQRYFKGLSRKPKYKSRKKSRLSFYVNYESLAKRNGGFHGEKIGFVKTAEPLPAIPDGSKYSNPRIIYDNKYWYLSVGYETVSFNVPLTGESKGIDLGIKDLAICSDGKIYKNINKTQRVKKITKRLKRAEHKLSRMIENNVESYMSNRRPIYKRPLEECKNIQKQKHVVQLLYRRLSNIRHNYVHQTTTEIVKTKPSRVVMETLNVRGMMKNKHLSRVIAEQMFRIFQDYMEYKCERYGIEFVRVPQFFPSSKICSNCGCIKSNLKLSDRVYHCNECGYTIDRDMNAAINLSNYEVA